MVAQAMEQAWQRNREGGGGEGLVDVTMRFSACMNKVTV